MIIARTNRMVIVDFMETRHLDGQCRMRNESIATSSKSTRAATWSDHPA
jgi:hypothetical protein